MSAPLPCLSKFIAQPAHPVLANLIFEGRTLQVFRGVFFGHSLTAQFCSNYRAFGAGLDRINLAMQRLPFQFRIETRYANRRVIRTRVFVYPAIASPRGIASRKMK